MTRPILAVCALSLAAVAVRAEITPHPLFCDGAVLQRDTPVPVWGFATKDEKVSVSLDGGAPVTTTASGGKWQVTLPARSAGGPHTLTIAGENTVTVNDVLFGEVWICSGQSNMEMNLTRNRHAVKAPLIAATLKDSDIPGVRLFDVANRVSATPEDKVSGKWMHCGPDSVRNFSTVGYWFASNLKKTLGDVPVGMIEADWGGTPAQAWTSREALAKLPAWKAKSEAYAKALATKPKTADPHQPSTLRNGMISPLIPYAFRGVIWYQGESNGSTVAAAKDYRTLFPAMIADWRKAWGRGDFPFLFVQIAPFQNQTPDIREAQFLTLAASPNTAMVQTLDVGDAKDIHPVRKEPVGTRLALAARALVYGEKVEYSGPLFAGASFDDGKATVAFTHAGSGLELKPGPKTLFQIAGADRVFHTATAAIEGGKLVVSSPEVTAPKAVRYAWMNTPEAVLFNKDGLPASPFRSDVD